MKRVIALVLLLSGVMALFAFNVSAENTYIRNIRTYSGYKSAASLTYSATACQFHYNSDTSLTGGIYSPVLITVRFTNNGSNDVKIANSYVDLTFTNTAEVQRYDCYTSDLMVQIAGTAGQHTPRYNIIGGDGFSYNGHIVVPHNSSIYLVFEVDIAGSINTSNGQPEGPGLDAVFVSVVDTDVQTGEFVTGIIPRQLDAIDTLLTNLYSSQAATLSQLQNMYSDVHTLLTDIKNQIRFTGTFVIPTISPYSFQNYNADVSNNDYLSSFTVRKTVFPYEVLNYDFELEGNTEYQYGFKRYVVYLRVDFHAAKNFVYNNFTVNLPFTSSQYITAKLADYESNFVGSIFLQRSLLYVYSSGSTSSKFIVPSGVNYIRLTLYIDVPLDVNVNFTDYTTLTSDPFNITGMSDYLGYYPHSIEQGIADIYSGMQSSSSVDISSGSNTLNQTESQVHQQEQLYFQQNAQAILDTGLSNYRFNTEQSNGIGAVSIDFTALWNALGSWNSVYVFALTLTIALTILRHAPNAISTARRRNYDHNDRSS